MLAFRAQRHQPVRALLLLILGTLFGGLGVLGLQRSRSGTQVDLGALLLGLASCLISVVLLLVVAARVLL